MNKKDANFSVKWDYEVEFKAPYTQKDWNQTLINKINQLSLQIHKSTFKGSANCIVIPSYLKKLIESLEYYNNGVISGKYRVIIDDTIEYDTIFVLLAYPPDGHEITNGLYPKMDDGQVWFVHRSNNEEEFERYRKSHMGYITIENYFKLG
jgi:hypothetical protein